MPQPCNNSESKRSGEGDRLVCGLSLLGRPRLLCYASAIGASRFQGLEIGMVNHPARSKRDAALLAALRPFADVGEAIEECVDLIDDEDRRDTVTINFGGMQVAELSADDFRAAMNLVYPPPLGPIGGG